jgi:hypothetical protein
MCETHAIGG